MGDPSGLETWKMREGPEGSPFNGVHVPSSTRLADFGIAGALFYCLVIGLVSGLFFGWLTRAPAAPLPLLLMAQVATALTLSPVFNKFNNTGAWYVAALSAAPFVLSRLLLPGRRYRADTKDLNNVAS